MKPSGIVYLAILGLLAAILFMALMSSCTPIEAGFVGVQRTFGDAHDVPLQPGLNWVKPFIDDVVPMETRLKSYEVQASAASKDLQIVTTLISVQHSLNGPTAPAAFETIGDLAAFDASVVAPAVMESLKAVTAQYTAEELITKRETVKQQVSDAIQKFITHTLEEKGVVGALHIANVAIKDFQFSAEFNSSIEAKVRAQQESLRALNEKQKRITEAEAAAAEVELQADAEAYQIEKSSVSRAAAIERESAALSKNPLLIQLRAIERWDGTLPRFSGNAVPFINLDGIGSDPAPSTP